MMQRQMLPCCIRDYRIVHYEWEEASTMQDSLLFSHKNNHSEVKYVKKKKAGHKIMLAWTYAHSDFHIIKDLLCLDFFSGLDPLGTT